MIFLCQIKATPNGVLVGFLDDVKKRGEREKKNSTSLASDCTDPGFFHISKKLSMPLFFAGNQLVIDKIIFFL